MRYPPCPAVQGYLGAYKNQTFLLWGDEAYDTLCNIENTNRSLGRAQGHRRRELGMKQATYLTLALFQDKEFPYQRIK